MVIHRDVLVIYMNTSNVILNTKKKSKHDSFSLSNIKILVYVCDMIETVYPLRVLRHDGGMYFHGHVSLKVHVTCVL